MTIDQFLWWVGRGSWRNRVERYERLNVTQQRQLPVTGTDWYPLHGVCIRVLPLSQKRTQARKSHRLVAACPFCDKVVSGGRLFQHLGRCQKVNFNE